MAEDNIQRKKKVNTTTTRYLLQTNSEINHRNCNGLCQSFFKVQYSRIIFTVDKRNIIIEYKFEGNIALWVFRVQKCCANPVKPIYTFGYPGKLPRNIARKNCPELPGSRLEQPGKLFRTTRISRRKAQKIGWSSPEISRHRHYAITENHTEQDQTNPGSPPETLKSSLEISRQPWKSRCVTQIFPAPADSSRQCT